MLPRAQEEGAIDQGVAVEDVHGLFAERAGNSRLVLPSQGREDEEARLVVAMVTLVLDLEQEGEFDILCHYIDEGWARGCLPGS